MMSPLGENPVGMPLKGVEGFSGGGSPRAYSDVLGGQHNGTAVCGEPGSLYPIGVSLHGCACGPLVLSMCIAAACWPRPKPLTGALVQVHRPVSEVLRKPPLLLYLTTTAFEVDCTSCTNLAAKSRTFCTTFSGAACGYLAASVNYGLAQDFNMWLICRGL